MRQDDRPKKGDLLTKEQQDASKEIAEKIRQNAEKILRENGATEKGGMNIFLTADERKRSFFG